MSAGMKFDHRYPHGVLTEQEGGVPNDVENWEDAKHVCRKHRKREWVCVDHIIERTACPACGAVRGQQCRTVVDGLDVGWMHDARIIADMHRGAS